MYSAQIISGSISRDICAQLAREVVNLVPQVVDFSCSICESHRRPHQLMTHMVVILRLTYLV
jgi:hypothetical protein